MTLRTMCPEASRPLTIVFVPWNLMPLGANTKRACTLPEAEETTETTRAWLVHWRAMRVLPTGTVTVSGPSGAAGAAGAAGPAGAASGTSGAATGEVGAEMMVSGVPAMSRNNATTRRRSPTSALPGMNVSPTTAPVTDSQTPGVVSCCQLNRTDERLMPPFASASAADTARASPAVGVVSLIVTVPVAGVLPGGLTAGTVVSENCSCSMFQRVSTPSVPPWLSTVMLPFALWVMV